MRNTSSAIIIIVITHYYTLVKINKNPFGHFVQTDFLFWEIVGSLLSELPITHFSLLMKDYFLFFS